MDEENTYIQTRNMLNASKEAPSALERVIKALFWEEGKKKDNTTVMFTIFIVIWVICGGYFTASIILKKTDRKYDALASYYSHK